MQWDVINKKEILKTVPFAVEELTLFDRLRGHELSHPYYRLTCTNWVNVLPITTDGQAVLIKQSRAGSLRDTLEIPGGMIGANERDPTLAACRELEEETGFTSKTILSLGAVNPNPAIMNNEQHMFVALNATPASPRQHFPDDGELIEVVKVPTNELESMVRLRRIDSALACLTIMLAGKFVKIN